MRVGYAGTKNVHIGETVGITPVWDFSWYVSKGKSRRRELKQLKRDALFHRRALQRMKKRHPDLFHTGRVSE